LGENHEVLFPSAYTNCETAVAFAEWLFGAEGKPPDLLSRLLALAKFMRCRLAGSAHAVVFSVACSKYGSREYFFFALSLLLPRVTPFLSRETIHRRHGSSITHRRLA
jgi:hypothetical protein